MDEKQTESLKATVFFSLQTNMKSERARERERERERERGIIRSENIKIYLDIYIYIYIQVIYVSIDEYINCASYYANTFGKPYVESGNI
jgi:hypothetical protein